MIDIRLFEIMVRIKHDVKRAKFIHIGKIVVNCIENWVMRSKHLKNVIEKVIAYKTIAQKVTKQNQQSKNNDVLGYVQSNGKFVKIYQFRWVQSINFWLHKMALT